MELFEDFEYQEEIGFKSNVLKKLNDNEIVNKDNYESYENKSEYMEIEKLPLPNINNLRKWIKKQKKAS